MRFRHPTDDENVETMSVAEMLAMEGSGWEGDLDAMRTDRHVEQWIDIGESEQNPPERRARR